MKKISLLLACTMLLAFRIAAQTAIFPFGSDWKYLDTGTDQGVSWRSPGFDDEAWETGLGYFGYGQRQEATLLDFGPDSADKFRTTYFRKAFTMANPLAFAFFTGRVKRDDGVVVYVNGKEVFRNNMPAGTIDYRTLASSASDHGRTALPFTINTAAFVRGSNVIAVELHQTNPYSFDLGFDLELLGTPATLNGDAQPPTLRAIDRQMPAAEKTNTTSVIYRITFSEPVIGVDVSDFTLVSTVGGTLTSLVAVGTDGSTYDATIGEISGSGSLGLNLKSEATGILDAASNPLSGGFTGQIYAIIHDRGAYGFTSVTALQAIPARVQATKGEQQAKVFTHAGKHWAVIASTGGTYLWRLDGTTWINVLRLSEKNARADCIVAADVTHILLFMGISSEFISLEYDSTAQTYRPWSARSNPVALTLDAGVESAAIARDGTGRMWLASDAETDIRVRYSDAPYTTWSDPVTIAAGLSPDDVCTLVAMPRTKEIGVFWSNQQTARYGFRTHQDGRAADAWSADEVPAGQSALPIGRGMADDHVNVKMARDGTLYCAVKTSYNTAGHPRLALLIRRPGGSWDPLHGISEIGTAPVVLLNEAVGKVRVVYASQTYGGDILYKESYTSRISFGQELTLISGINDYATSAHQQSSGEVVILASNEEETLGVLARDGLATDTALADMQAGVVGYPNPFSSKTRIRFALPADGPYTFTLLNRIGQVMGQQQGAGKAGKHNFIEIEGGGLRNGLYFARIQTREVSRVLRLVLTR
jgi:hypothetical protein